MEAGSDPPGPLDALLRRLEEFRVTAEALVALEGIPFREIERAVLAVADELERHPGRMVAGGAGPPPGGPRPRPDRLAEEHLAFPTAAEQLRWLLDIVRRDGHGGNRQALGQYARLVVESVGAHAREELALSGTRYVGDRTTPVPAGSGPAR